MGGHDFGFELVGGKEDPQFPSDNSLFVSHIIKGGTAEGKLRSAMEELHHCIRYSFYCTMWHDGRF